LPAGQAKSGNWTAKNPKILYKHCVKIIKRLFANCWQIFEFKFAVKKFRKCDLRILWFSKTKAYLNLLIFLFSISLSLYFCQKVAIPICDLLEVKIIHFSSQIYHIFKIQFIRCLTTLDSLRN
jgi:hypothetical protein